MKNMVHWRQVDQEFKVSLGYKEYPVSYNRQHVVVLSIPTGEAKADGSSL